MLCKLPGMGGAPGLVRLRKPFAERANVPSYLNKLERAVDVRSKGLGGWVSGDEGEGWVGGEGVPSGEWSPAAEGSFAKRVCLLDGLQFPRPKAGSGMPPPAPAP
mmetsp:Transcript_40352/g.48916  ORF Transcript_40352/g.48916 Transcript_40352/m.48916 type:complete len:105 (-) Transcript_40352:615-929(-)